MATTEAVEEGQDSAEESAPRKLNIASILLTAGAISAAGTMALWWLGDLSPEPELEVGRTLEHAPAEPIDLAAAVHRRRGN